MPYRVDIPLQSLLRSSTTSPPAITALACDCMQHVRYQEMKQATYWEILTGPSNSWNMLLLVKMGGGSSANAPAVISTIVGFPGGPRPWAFPSLSHLCSIASRPFLTSEFIAHTIFFLIFSISNCALPAFFSCANVLASKWIAR